MGRILFFIFLALVGWWLFKSWQRKLSDEDTPPNDQGSKENAQVNNAKESIYPCKHCGAYSPMSAGVMVEGRFYCNFAHAKAEGERVQ